MAAPVPLCTRTPGPWSPSERYPLAKPPKSQEESWLRSPAPTSALTSHTRHRGARRLEAAGKWSSARGRTACREAGSGPSPTPAEP